MRENEGKYKIVGGPNNRAIGNFHYWYKMAWNIRFTRIYGRLRRPMRGLRRTARFARLHAPPLASLATPSCSLRSPHPANSRFCHSQWVYITHRKFHQNQSKGSGDTGGHYSKKYPRNQFFFFAKSIFFFFAFFWHPQGVSIMHAKFHQNRSRGSGVIRGDTHTHNWNAYLSFDILI